MDSRQYRRLKEVFADARELPVEKQEAFVRDACSDDPEVLAEALAMIQLDRRESHGILDQALLGDGVGRRTAPSVMPERIAGYRIVGVCGHGGMGTVYEAQQNAPRRRVALKVVRAGLMSDDALARFERESEILGRLQHPGVAQVYEAGEFELQGTMLPFFAMEFVEGPSLMRYAEGRDLSSDERIDLFLRVCDAVHYAHQQGVIHRDLKPENVLVVEGSSGGSTSASPIPSRAASRRASLAGQPKILDFGVARLTDTDLRATLSTSAGQLLGSVPYMSPEQAAAQPERVDARSDVYALGILLYELLVGRLPYRVTDRPLADALATIQNDEPTRLGSLDSRYRGDLETIVGKCLEKEAAWRYSSVADLADDLRRFRADQPISARRPSTWYQLRKFARRNRALVGGAVATTTALVIGLVVAVLFGLRAVRNENRALGLAYRAKLTATNALLDTDPLAARRTLDSISAEQRGWEWRHLDSCLSTQLLEFGQYAEGSPLVAVADGGQILAARDKLTLARWDLETGTELETWLAPGPVEVWGIAPDGSRVAVALDNGEVHLRDLGDSNAGGGADGEWELWQTGFEPVGALAFAPDARRLAVMRRDRVFLGDGKAWLEGSIRAEEPVEATFAPDGARLLACARSLFSAEVRLFDVQSMEVLARRQTLDPPAGFSFSPDGTQLVSGSNRRDLLVYDPDTLEELEVWSAHTQPPVFTRFGEPGILSTADDGTLRLWSEDGEALGVWRDESAERAIFATPERIASAGGGRLRVLSVEPTARRTLQGHETYVYELSYSGDGRWLASHSPFEPSEIFVWGAVGGRALARLEAKYVHGTLMFGRGGELALAGGSRAYAYPWFLGESSLVPIALPLMHAWDQRTGMLDTANARGALDNPEALTIHRAVYSTASDPGLAVFADGDEVVLGPGREGVLLRVGSTPQLSVGSMHGFNSCYSGALSELVVYGGSVSADESARIEAHLDRRRSGAEGELPSIVEAELLAHLVAEPTSLSMGRDHAEREVVTEWRSRNDPELVLRAAGEPEFSCVYRPAGDALPSHLWFDNLHRNARWLEAPFPAVAGFEVVTVFWLGSYRDRWGASHGAAYGIGTFETPPKRWPERDDRVRRLSAVESTSANGQLRATTSPQTQTSVRIRDLRSGGLIHELHGDYGGVDFHPSELLLACGTAEGVVELWDPMAGVRLHEIQAHEGYVYAVAWSPDGSRLATGGNDAAVRIWDAKTLEPLLELRGHRKYVKALAFSPDGTQLASGSGDCTVRIWDSERPSERHHQLRSMQALEGEVRPQVERWLESLPNGAAVVNEIRAAWAEDEARRRAALTVLATLSEG